MPRPRPTAHHRETANSTTARISRAGVGDPKIGQNRHQRFDRRLGPRVFRDPGLQFPGPHWERVDVEGGRQPPLAPIDARESVIAQMVLPAKGGRNSV